MSMNRLIRWTLFASLAFFAGCDRDEDSSQITRDQPGEVEPPRVIDPRRDSELPVSAGVNQDALRFMQNWLQTRFISTPNGWVTKVRVYLELISQPDEESDYTKYIAQIKTLKILTMEEDPLGEADRLNGIQWQGRFNFAPTVFRIANPPYNEWTQWLDSPGFSVYAQRLNDVWTLQPCLVISPIGMLDTGAVAGAMGSPSVRELESLAMSESPEALQRKEIIEALQRQGPPR